MYLVYFISFVEEALRRFIDYLGAANQLPDDETRVSRLERRVEEEDGGASGGDLPGVWFYGGGNRGGGEVDSEGRSEV